MPPASSLQPASLVVPPCQDIAYHIPNQEDNKVVKEERERERNCAIIITLLLTPQLNYPSLFQKVTFYTLRIRSREHVDYILLLLLLPPPPPPPPASSHLQSGESVNQ